MSASIDLNPKHHKIVSDILYEYAPDRDVLVFGSRAKWNAKDKSDLDLCIMGDEPLPKKAILALTDAFEESALPLKVDVVEWAKIEGAFREIIKRDGVKLGWPELQISDVAEFQNNKRIPLKSLDREKRKGIYPYYGASGIVDHIDDYIFDGTYLLISEDGENLRTRNTPIAFKARGKFWVNNHAHILSEKEAGILDYLEYYFSALDISPYITGAVQPKLNKANLDYIKIPIPPLNERILINNVLNSLTNKIELNQRMNETLEAMARALFKSWFVDFDPVRAKAEGRQPEGMDAATAALFPATFNADGLPEGWEEKRVGDAVDTISKTYPLKSVSEVIFLNTGDIQDGKFLHSNKSDASSLPGQAKKSIQRGDILYSEIRPENRRYAYVYFDTPEYVVSTKLMVLRSTSEIPSLFIYFILIQKSSIDWLQMMAESRSGTFPQITYDVLSRVSYIGPKNSEIINIFTKQVLEPFYQKIIANDAESAKLSALRDALLPKLISGELRINDVTIQPLKEAAG